MSQSHDLTLRCPGSDLEGVGQGLALDDERMIARGHEGVLEPREQAAPAVKDGAGRAVEQARGRHPPGAVHLGEGLVPEADPQDGQAAGEPPEGLEGDARSGRLPGPGGHHESLERTGGQRLGRDVPVAVDLDLRAEHGEALEQAAREGAVVLDQRDHGSDPCARARARSRSRPRSDTSRQAASGSVSAAITAAALQSAHPPATVSVCAALHSSRPPRRSK